MANNPQNRSRIFQPAPTWTQNSATESVLQRYSELNIDRQGPTIDAQLAQKMLRRGNTYNNLQRRLAW